MASQVRENKNGVPKLIKYFMKVCNCFECYYLDWRLTGIRNVEVTRELPKAFLVDSTTLLDHVEPLYGFKQYSSWRHITSISYKTAICWLEQEI